MNVNLLTRVALATLAISVTTHFAVAQVAPGATQRSKASEDASDELTTMSPFHVSTERDTGFIAADTISAGRLSTNLLMTPGNFDVLTRDLLNDLGVVNIDEAAGWLTNSRPLELGAIESNSLNPASLSQSDSATNVTLRGLSGQPSTRNYFTGSTTPKEYNVERVESSRGPNAILYGEGGPGGQVNYLTKRAQSRNFSTVRLRGDSLWSKGISLDLNRKLTKNLDVRYNGNVLDQRYHISRTRFTEVGNALNVMYRPFSNNVISFDTAYSRNSRPGLIMSYSDRFSRWNGVPVAGKLTTAQATAGGLTNLSAVRRLTWVEGIGMIDLAGHPISTGHGLPVVTEYSYGEALFPNIESQRPPERSFNVNPRDGDVVDHAFDAQVTIGHTFSNKLSMELAGQVSKYTADGGNYNFTAMLVDAMATLPDGSPNPNVGKPFSSSYLGRSIDATREARTARFVMAYPIRFLGGVTSVSLFAQHEEKESDTAWYDKQISDPTSTLPITNAANRIWLHRYWDNLTEELPDFSKLYDLVDVPTAHGITQNKNDAIMVAASGSYLKDSLTFIAGFRRDRSELTTENGVVATRDRVTGRFVDYTVDPRTAYNNTLTAGLVYFPIRTVGFYVNRGEGFNIQTVANPRLDGSFTKANIVPAEDESYGLRFHLNRGSDVKIVGSIGHYHAKQTGSAFGIIVSNVNQLWSNHGMEDKYIVTFSPSPISTAGTNAITSSRSYEGSGWEASLTANFGNSFRLIVNGALPKTKQSDVGSDYVKYLQANMQTWEAWANQTLQENPTKVNDTQMLNNIKQSITNSEEGRAQNLTYTHRYNILGVYTFQTTALKGLRVGAGGQFFGKSIIGSHIGQPFNYIYAKDYYLLRADLGYPIKFGKRKMNLQLNIDNLLNYDKPTYNGVFNYASPNGPTLIPYGFKYVWPRAARLTITIPF